MDLRHEREKRGLSLRDLSIRGGLSIGNLSEIERGIKSPTVATLGRIAEAYGCDLWIQFAKGDEMVEPFDDSRRLGIVWREPPAPKRGRWEAVVELLEANPGRWALVGTYASTRTAQTTVQRIRKRFERCEFTVAGNEVYGRYKKHPGRPRGVTKSSETP